MRWRLAARSGPAAAGHGGTGEGWIAPNSNPICYGSKHGFPTLDSVRDYFEVASAPG
jgi:hypothetical protein